MSTGNYTKGRTGWNQRGPSDKDTLRIQRNPSANQEWTRQRALLADELVGLIGQAAYYLWARETISTASPREAYALTAEKLDQVHAGYDRLWRAVVEIDMAVER